MTLLVIDLNTVISKLVKNPWDFKTLEESIKNFAYFSKNAGFCLEIFANPHSISNIWKWKITALELLTKTEDLLKEKPPEFDLLVEDLFKLYEVKVLYPKNAPIIDVMASYASNKKALIISNSSDILNSKEYDFKVYKSFSMDSEKKVLILQDPLDDKLIKYKKNLKLLNKFTFSDNWIDLNITFLSYKDWNYMKFPNISLKYFDNPHITIRPLRQALYKLLKINEPITEIFPVYNKGKYTWDSQKIKADEKFDEKFKFLLFKPDEAIRYFFPVINDLNKNIREDDLKYYIYNVVSVTLEICSVALEKSFFELIQTYLPHFSKGLSLEEFFSNEKMKIINEDKIEKIKKNSNLQEEEIKEIFHESHKKRDKGKNFICKQCQRNFFISDAEKIFMEEKKFSLPKRCKDCRRVRRNAKYHFSQGKTGIKDYITDVYDKGEYEKKLLKKMKKCEKKSNEIINLFR